MTYELTLSIAEESPAGQIIENTANTEHLSREEAVLKLIERTQKPKGASAQARRIVGLFSSPEDVALMDDVMEIVHAERERQKAELPRDF